jgi:uncharacterized protein YjbI with pentapeptide repeats
MVTEIPLRLQFDDTCIKCKTFLPKGTNFYRNSEGQTNCVECYQSVDDEILSEQDLSNQNFSKKDLEFENLSNKNLSHTNLTETNLTEADLTNANLTEADLTNANLTEADLTNANLSHANLSHTNLTEADLTNANLSHANLTEADLTHVDFSEVNLSHTNLKGALLDDFYTNFSHANLSHADLRGIVSVGYAGVSHKPSSRLGSNFNCADLSYAKLNELDLGSFFAVDNDPILYKTNLSGVQATPCTFPHINLKKCKISNSIFRGSDFNSGDFSDVIACNVDFRHGEWKNAVFTNADLKNTDFSWSHLEFVDFTGSDLRNVNFIGAELSYCKMKNTQLTGAIFVESFGFDTIDFGGSIPRGIIRTRHQLKENIRKFVPSESDIFGGRGAPF